MSRTFLRKDIIGPNDFHGAAFYKNLAEKDLTYHFIDAIEKNFDDFPEINSPEVEKNSGLTEINKIAEFFKINDVNLIKPSIGEATRVLLRRLPWKILVHSLHDEENLGHLYQLAEEKGAKLEIWPLKCYKACGLIRNLADN